MDKKTLHRFQKKIELDLLTGCWNWTAATIKSGYGYFSYNGKPRLSHRISYEHWNGKIPNGLHIDHICRNRLCANPSHLEVVTNKENCNRGVHPKGIYHHYGKKTHCIRNHPFDKNNTYRDSKGSRQCIKCSRMRVKEHRSKNKIGIRG